MRTRSRAQAERVRLAGNRPRKRQRQLQRRVNFDGIRELWLARQKAGPGSIADYIGKGQYLLPFPSIPEGKPWRRDESRFVTASTTPAPQVHVIEGTHTTGRANSVPTLDVPRW